MTPEQQEKTAQCPGCSGEDVRKHGKHLGKQRYYCKKCGLAFTGGAYHTRPEHETAGLRRDVQRLAKTVEAARRMEAALGVYLESKTGKDLSNLKSKRERFLRLLDELAGIGLMSGTILEEADGDLPGVVMVR